MKRPSTVVIKKQAEKILSGKLFRSLPVSDKIKAKVAFTLAEVLITLTVIGVLAAMTIPALVNYINDQELKAKWLKAYATVYQATERTRIENGGTNLDQAFKTCVTTDPELVTIMNSYATNYNASKVYSSSTCGNFGNILRPMYKVSNASTVIKEPDGTYDPLTNWTCGGIGLNDGTFLFYTSGDVNCSTSVHKILGGRCYRIWVDVNGAKPPNTWGKDLFGIIVAKNGIYPTGVNPSTLALDACDGTSNFYNCGAWILANPDYKVPW